MIQLADCKRTTKRSPDDMDGACDDYRNVGMVNEWFYRMFGEEFGPMPFEELKDLALTGSISAADEVRLANSNQWVAAATIVELGLPNEGEGASERVTGGSDADIDTLVTKNADDWFCVIGGSELGPLTFEELTSYAENEQLTADDEVKLGEHGKWRRVGSIGRLMAVIPYKSIEKTVVPTVLKSKTPAVEIATIDDIDVGVDEANDGMEEFEDLSSLVMEPHESEVPFLAPPQPNAGGLEAAFHAGFNVAKARITEVMMAQAEARFKTTEEQAQAQIAWASDSNVDSQWWGWAGGVKFGPVDFAQVFGLAESGQLKPTDLVRNGEFGQFVPSANIPGLVSSVLMISQAADALALARSQAQAIVALALSSPPAYGSILESFPIPAPVSNTSRTASASGTHRPSVSKSDPTLGAISRNERSAPNLDLVAKIESQSPVEPVEEVSRPLSTVPSDSRPRESSSSISGGFASLAATTKSSAVHRPVVLPKKTKSTGSGRSSSSWFSSALGELKEPKALGALGTIALVLLVVGWNFLPTSRAQDIRHYRALKGILDEIRAKQNSPNELTSMKSKLATIAKEIAEDLKKKASSDDPAKQRLLWAARDEFPRFAQAGFARESDAEIRFTAVLQAAAWELGLEPRSSTHTAIAQTAPLPDD